jgi:hypothetical protein
MFRYSTIALVIAALFAISGVAQAGGYKARPGVYDPNRAGCPVAEWKTRVGLPDSGRSSHGLVLQKNCSTTTEAAAGATIDGVEGLSADGLVLGYDIRGYCGAGAPRFNVVASDGFHFVGGCANGDVVGSPAPGWSTVRFELQDPSSAFPVVDPNATISSITLLSDEEGASIVDNIFIGYAGGDPLAVIGKPGND